MTNHPKQGGIPTFLCFGHIYLAGKELTWPSPNSPELSASFRAGPIEAYDGEPTIQPETPRLQPAKQTAQSASAPKESFKASDFCHRFA